MVHTLNFETLGIETTDPHHQLRDDGYVENIEKHLDIVSEELGVNFDEQFANLADSGDSVTNAVYAGLYLRVPDTSSCMNLIFTEDTGLEDTNLSNKVHEEVHAVHGTGNLDLLEEKIQGPIPHFSFGDLSDYQNCSADEREYVAGIGSCYVLDREGISISEQKKFQGSYAVKKAFDDYEALMAGEPVEVGV